MRGYKAFDKDLKCRNLQYKVGKTTKIKGKLMAYPQTIEERLIKLYGLNLSDLQKIFLECNKDWVLYKKKLEELDKSIALNVYNEMTSDKFLLH